MNPQGRLYAALIALALICAAGCGGAGTEEASQRQMDNFDGAPTTIKVFISNGHTQCNNDAIPPSQTQMTLVQGGIDVLDSACGVVTGLTSITVCGGPTGEINLHTIRRVNLQDAEALGFGNAEAIGVDPQIPGTGYKEVACQ